jgi:hypothetical protein
MRWAATSQRYVPEEIAPYAADLDANGAWSYETDIGYVWRPTVEVDWQPYVHGRWAWSIFGWTWIPAERWGWISCHYGRWGHSARLGWYWIPRRGFSPAWVHWARGNGQVGWCPLDRNNRPLEMERAIRISRAAQRRGYRGNGGMTHGAWIFSRHEDLRTPDLARRSLLGHDPGARGLRLSETFRERPSRNLARLERVDPRPVMARRSERRERTLPSALSAAPTRRRAGETSSWNHDNGSGSDAGSGVVRRPQMPRPRGDENDRAREAAPRERRDEPRSRIFQRDDSESRWRARTQAQDSERPRIFTPRRDETPAPNRDDRVFRRSHEERRSEGIFPRMRRENPAPERHGERREREYRPPPTQRFPSERRGETERAQPERRMERESSRPNSGERGNHRRNRN